MKRLKISTSKKEKVIANVKRKLSLIRRAGQGQVQEEILIELNIEHSTLNIYNLIVITHCCY